MSTIISYFNIHKHEKCNCQYFSFYEQLNIRAQMSWAWKTFYNLGTWKYILTWILATKCVYTTFTIFSIKYLVMCKIYTDVGGIK